MNNPTLHAPRRCICRRRDGDDVVLICAMFLLYTVLFAR